MGTLEEWILLGSLIEAKDNEGSTHVELEKNNERRERIGPDMNERDVWQEDRDE